MKRHAALLILVAGTIVAGCAFRVDKDAPGVMAGGQPTLHRALNPATIGFAEVNARILQSNHCLMCHGGHHAPSLTSYAEVVANLDLIQKQVIQLKKMPPPPGAPMSEDDQDFLQAWIDQGAPETAASPAPSPLPAPSESPVVAGPRPPVTWKVLRTEVLATSCLNCHFAHNPDGISNFDDAPTVRADIGTILGLSIVSPLMPPPPDNLPAGAVNPNQLTRDQKDTLSHWVVDGMTD